MTQFSVQEAMKKLRGKRAVLAGDLMLDAYLYGETVRVSREAPVLVVRKERIEHRLGGAANTAANLAALGVETEVLGITGHDASGQQLREMLTKAGTSVEFVRSGARMTPVKTRILAGAFGTSRQQVLRIDEDPGEHWPAPVLEQMARDLEERGAKADVVVVSDYGFGLAAEPLLSAAQRLARRGIPVCADSRFQLQLFRGLTAVTPNLLEIENTLGVAVTDQAAVERAGWELVERLGCEAALIKQGRMGMTLFRAGAPSSHVDIVGDDKVVDVTGAGDTVIASFSAALAGGLGTENAMRLANVAGGIKVTKLGTATVSPTELIAKAERHGVSLLPWAE